MKIRGRGRASGSVFLRILRFEIGRTVLLESRGHRDRRYYGHGRPLFGVLSCVESLGGKTGVVRTESFHFYVDKLQNQNNECLYEVCLLGFHSAHVDVFMELILLLLQQSLA